MSKLVNIAHLVANIYLLVRILSKLFKEDFSQLAYFSGNNNLQSEIEFLRWLQFAQITDFVFSKGSKFSILLQYASRIILPFFFMTPNTSSLAIYGVTICWIFADSVRYSFYTVKNSVITALRYNMFLVLYPLGVAHELIILFEYQKQYVADSCAQVQPHVAAFFDYFQKNCQAQNEIALYMNYFNCFALFAGLPFLYSYLWGMRARYYKKLKAQKAQKTKTQKKQN